MIRWPAIPSRRDELAWFNALARETLPPQLSQRLVLHRGYHDVKDRSHRPLENTLAAYEQAWTSGVDLCECDVAITSDHQIVLCHDTTFQRVALDPDSANAQKPVGQLTLREVMALPLKDGCRAPTLLEVLRSAAAIGGHAKLVVEMKSGNLAAPAALCELFAKQPDLLRFVAVVMSFDASLVHAFAADSRISEVEGRPLVLQITNAHIDPPAAVLSVKAPALLEQSQRLAASGGLDGLYMRFEPSMIEDPPSRDRFEALCRQCTVGVWMDSNTDPDSMVRAMELIKGGADFVNTDFPREFARQPVLRRRSKNLFGGPS